MMKASDLSNSANSMLLTKSKNQYLFGHLINNLLTGIIVADSEFRCVYVNATVEQILSTSQTTLLNENVIDILLPFLPTASKTTNSIDSINKLQQPNNADDSNLYTEKLSLIKQFEHTKSLYQAFIYHDCTILGLSHLGIGEPLLVDYGVSPMETEDGFYYLIELWAKDRESQIQQEQQQHAQHHITRQLIRSMAHEVKNPLAGILGASQLLQKNLYQVVNATLETDSINDSKLNKVTTYLDIIMNETRRLNNLVTQLLGSPTLPDWQSLNIHEPIEHVLTLLGLQHPNIKLLRDYDLSLPEIIADKDQLIQVFINLINNAIQALNENAIDTPSITIRTRVSHQHTIGDIRHKSVLRIDVIDNGLGIDSTLLPQIFYPLVTGRAKGTGLGLALVQDIIQRHQGLITVSSKPGETQFSLFLPWQQAKIGNKSSL